MKKILYVLPLLAALFAVSCSSEDDEKVAQNYEVNVSVLCTDGLTFSQITDMAVEAVNSRTGAKQTATPDESHKAAFKLPTGTYDFRITGKEGTHDLNGVTPNVFVNADKEVEITIGYAAANSALVFKEVYFTGVKDFYFKDAFYEIYNNSDEVQYLDGVILGIVDDGLPAGVFLPESSIWFEDGKLPNDCYPMCNFTMYFPGNGTDYPLEPGKSVVIANSAIDHSARELNDGDEKSPVNLVNADWEMFVDKNTILLTDNPDVPDLLFAYKNMGIQFMPSTSGQALILAKLPEGETMEDYLTKTESFMVKKGTTTAPHLMIPASCVIDAVDIVRCAVTDRYKHLLPKDDMGMVWIDGPDNEAAYSGKSLRRKVASIENGRAKLKDTNNSSVDFIVGGSIPTPGVIPTTVDE